MILYANADDISGCTTKENINTVYNQTSIKAEADLVREKEGKIKRETWNQRKQTNYRQER